MQPQLSESTAVSWGGDTLNAAQAAGARAAFESIESFTEKVEVFKVQLML